MDVPLQRHRVAVIEVQAERLGVELVDEPRARHDLVLGQRAVHLGRMPAVKVDRVRMRALVQELDADAIAFGRADRRAGHLAVVGPGRKEHAGRDLDLAIDGDDLVLAQQRAVGPRCFAVVARAPVRRARSEKFQARRNADGLNASVDTRPTGPGLMGGVRHASPPRRPAACACRPARAAPARAAAAEPSPARRSSERRVSGMHLI